MSRRAGIEEPITTALERVLRNAVVAYASSEHPHHARPTLHAGIPGAAEVRALTLEPDHRLDHALRCDMVQAIVRSDLRRQQVPLIWLTRPDGAFDEEDAAWSAAVHAAGAELDVALDLVVVTPRTWRDPRTGTGRRWRRTLRPRPD